MKPTASKLPRPELLELGQAQVRVRVQVLEPAWVPEPVLGLARVLVPELAWVPEPGLEQVRHNQRLPDRSPVPLPSPIPIFFFSSSSPPP